MPDSIKSNNKSPKPKKAGRFATPEEAALAKNANLIKHVKKLGLKVENLTSSKK